MGQPICTTDAIFGTIEYKLNGRYHRTDGPARIFRDGSEVWYQNGQRHRTDGPAVLDIDPAGFREWRQHGKLHREDGPAVINVDGSEEYWLNGEKVDILVHFLQRK